MTMSSSPTGSTRPGDVEMLRTVFRLAEEARVDGRLPFAAMVVDANGTITSKVFNNTRPPHGDPIQHAELLASAMAFHILTQEEMAACTLYSNTEPCPMCAGAIYWSGIGRVVYGLPRNRLVEFVEKKPGNHTINLPCRQVFGVDQRHQVEVVGPLLEDEAAKVFEGYWGGKP